VLVPLSREPTELEWSRIVEPLGANSIDKIGAKLVQHEIEEELKPASTLSPFRAMVEALMDAKFPKELVSCLPKKWERIGHIVILKKLHPKLISHHQDIAQALLKVLKGTGNRRSSSLLEMFAETVLLDEEGIKGELRQPKLIAILNTSTS